MSDVPEISAAVKAEVELNALLDTVAPPACEWTKTAGGEPCGAEATGMALFRPCGCTPYLCKGHGTGLRDVLAKAMLVSFMTDDAYTVDCLGWSTPHPETACEDVHWRPIS